jgi:hypothetical protein
MSTLLTISFVLLARIGAQSMDISLSILCKSQRNAKTVETHALIDSRTKEDILYQNFVNHHQIDLLSLKTPIIPQKGDGTLNISGKITHYIYVNIIFNN